MSATKKLARMPLVSGNWKMHHNHFEALQLIQKLHYLLSSDDFDAVEISVHPPFTDLRTVQTYLMGEKEPVPIALGAQHCYYEDAGAFTGKISPSFLAKLDVRYVVVGHSERRELFGQTDEIVNRTLHAILHHGMKAILCVGETLEERETSMTQAKVTAQVEVGLGGLSADQMANVVVAYEPIWAIGTGRTAGAQDAQEVCALVRNVIEMKFGRDVAQQTRVQYGGSVKPSNAAELIGQPDIDGSLVGGASLVAEEFATIVRESHAAQ